MARNPNTQAPIPWHRRRRAFTLTEVLVTVSVLIIVLGLMVSLARYVRNQAATELTRDLLIKLDGLLKQYQTAHNGELPAVAPFVSPMSSQTPTTAPVAPADEPTLRSQALANNRDFVAAFKAEVGLSQQLFGPVAASVYDQVTLRDAWGRPIVLMSRGDPRIGTAMQDRPFFFSAGPDGKYHTLEDNVYSYEVVIGDP